MVKASLSKRRSQIGAKKNYNLSLNGDVKDDLTQVNKSTPNVKSKTPAKSDNETFHDAFVNEYSVPTNLYRYLTWRHKTKPILLHRNLSFFRKIRNKNKRSLNSLKEIVDKLLPNAKPITHNEHSKTVQNSAQFKFQFEGFFDSEVEKEWSTVEASMTAYVEHHWSHNRKMTSGRIMVPLANNLTLCCNPGDASRLDPLSLQSSHNAEEDKDVDNSVFLYRESLSSIDIANKIHSSFLVFKINASEKKIYSKVYDSPPNRRKSARRPDVFPVHYHCVIPIYYSPHKHLPSISAQMNLKSASNSYKLTPGSYEARLDVDVAPIMPSSDHFAPGELKHEKSTDSPDLEWLNVNFGNRSSAISEYLRWPVIRFSVEALPGVGITSGDANVKDAEISTSEEDQGVSMPPVAISPTRPVHKSSLSVTYRFLFHSEVAQWSEVKDLVCPWCRLDCGSVGPEGLLCHLNGFHPRFHFKWRVNRAGDRLSIRVSVKRDIEGDLTDIGLMRSVNPENRAKPVKRAPCGTLLCYKIPSKIPKRPDPTKYPPYADGHTRLYCHTWSSQSMRPAVFDHDSEEEDTLSWLHGHYKKNLHEFTDVNVGEKRIMQLWNSHLIRHNLVGDCQVSEAVSTFVREHLDTVRAEQLRGNLVLHLANLADFGLLLPGGLDDAMRIVDDLAENV